MLLADKAALITGASRGIGKAIAERLAGEGASVVLLGRTDEVRSVADALVARGSRAVAVQGDLADPATAKAAIAACRAQGGRLDVLVNNAGEQHPTERFEDIDEAQLERTFPARQVACVGQEARDRTSKPTPITPDKGQVLLVGDRADVEEIPSDGDRARLLLDR